MEHSKVLVLEINPDSLVFVSSIVGTTALSVEIGQKQGPGSNFSSFSLSVDVSIQTQ